MDILLLLLTPAVVDNYMYYVVKQDISYLHVSGYNNKQMRLVDFWIRL